MTFGGHIVHLRPCASRSGANDATRATNKLYALQKSCDCPIHLTLKMTSAQVVETSVTNNSSFQNYTHPDDHTIRTTIQNTLKVHPCQRRKTTTESSYEPSHARQTAQPCHEERPLV